MASSTTNYNLIKPDYEDDADIKDLNDNFDTIDMAMNNLEEGKQAALTTAQIAAVNSGIDSTKVAQIATNENNISTDEAALVELVDGGAKNIVNLQAPTASRDTTYTLADNGAVIMSVSSKSWTQYVIDNVAVVTGKKYILHLTAEDVTGDTSAFGVFVYQGGTSTIVSNGNLTNNQVLLNFTAPTSTIKIGIYLNNDNTARSCSAKCKLMICAKPSWDISQAYQPYRPSYQELYERVVALEQANQ